MYAGIGRGTWERESCPCDRPPGSSRTPASPDQSPLSTPCSYGSRAAEGNCQNSQQHGTPQRPATSVWFDGSHDCTFLNFAIGKKRPRVDRSLGPKSDSGTAERSRPKQPAFQDHTVLMTGRTPSRNDRVAKTWRQTGGRYGIVGGNGNDGVRWRSRRQLDGRRLITAHGCRLIRIIDPQRHDASLR